MIQKATFGGGCFWCTEAIFNRILGVLSVTSGYAGGKIENPTYEQVSSGSSGHAESIQIEFDDEKITYKKLLEIFFATHDPTTLNKQGADTGTQYRSVIFYHDEEQKQMAQEVIAELNTTKFHNKIVTQLEPYTNFYNAEAYHQKFYEQNGTHAYCQIVIDPKVKKLLQEFKEYTADAH